MNIQSQLNNLQQRISDIEKRNRRVEVDKLWETSITRRIIIAALTYVVISLFLKALGNNQPFINAIIPTMGFILSTFSVSFFKKVWIYFKKK